MHLISVVELEVNVLDDKRPNIVAETVRVKVSLHRSVSHMLKARRKSKQP